MSPLFSIIIPTYNRSGVIGRALDSCLAQTFGDFEVIVVDDGSQDVVETEAAVRTRDDGRISYLRQANAGAAVARNIGAAVARGRYLAFLDSDDEFLPDKLMAIHAAIEAQSDVEQTVWYSRLRLYRTESNQLVRPGRAIAAEEAVADYLFAFDGLMQTSTLVVPAQLFAKVGFDPTLKNLQDLDLCLRLERAGARFCMIPEVHVIWNDLPTDGRLTCTTKADEVTVWIERQRPLISEQAYYGFLARYLVPRIMRSNPIQALQVLWAAVRKQSISPTHAASVLIRNAAPQVHAILRDSPVKRWWVPP